MPRLAVEFIERRNNSYSIQKLRTLKSPEYIVQKNGFITDKVNRMVELFLTWNYFYPIDKKF